MHGIAQQDGRQNSGLIFCRLWTKVYLCKVSAVRNAVFWLTMSCCVPEIFTMKLWNCLKSRQNFDVFGPPNFGGKGPAKLLTEFYKSALPSNTWQSLVTIGQATSKIRQRKTENLNNSSKTVWPAASTDSGRTQMALARCTSVTDDTWTDHAMVTSVAIGRIAFSDASQKPININNWSSPCHYMPLICSQHINVLWLTDRLMIWPQLC